MFAHWVLFGQCEQTGSSAVVHLNLMFLSEYEISSFLGEVLVCHSVKITTSVAYEFGGSLLG